MPREDRLVDLSADRHGAQHDGIEVKEFPRSATVNFLRDRVPQLAQASDAELDRLASVLGDLALAAHGLRPAADVATLTNDPDSGRWENSRQLHTRPHQ
jgi:hypothetical protein